MKKLVKLIKKTNDKINNRFFDVSVYVNRYQDLITENCSEAKNIVHLGAGRGNFKIFNRKARFSGKLIALDVNEETLKLNPNRIKIVADAEAMPFDDNSIDLIVTEHTFEHLQNPEKVLKECYRVLKPKGKLIFATPNKWSYISLLGLLIPFKWHIPLDKLRGHKESDIDCCPTLYRLNTLSKIKNSAQKTGFKIEKLESYTGEPCYTTFLPGIHLLFAFWHKLLEKCGLLKNFRISIVGVFEKTKRKRILVNTFSATSGGGLTYLYNITNQIAKTDKDNEYLFLISSMMYSKFSPVETANMKFWPCDLTKRNLFYRAFWSQFAIRRFIKEKKIDVLFSAGNFGLLFSPVKQVLFSRNPVYFSKDFDRDLLKRREYGKWLMNQLKKVWSISSILSADVNLVPTDAFGRYIRKNRLLKKVNFVTLHHGFDKDYFTRDKAPLSKEILDKLKLKENYKRIIFVSHYNYFRNFETLIKAIPHLKKLLPKEKIMIILTTKLRKGTAHRGFNTNYAAELVDELNVGSDIVMLGGTPYQKLHYLYKLSDISVCPSYAESFGHPLVEAMATGTPVAVAKTPIHKEVCQKAALYFNVFDERDLAQKCAKILEDKKLYRVLRKQGFQRYKDFSWEKHFKKLLRIL